MKATRRLDGQYRFMLRVEHHVDFDDICAMVANLIHRRDFLEVLPYGRNGAEAAVRHYLMKHGRPDCGVLDGVPGNLLYDVRRKLALFFPEVDPVVGNPPERYNNWSPPGEEVEDDDSQ